MNGSLARRLDRLEERLPPPSARGEGGAGDRLLEQLAKIAERLHAEGRPLMDAPREAPIYRCVVAAMQDAGRVAAWGTPEWGARFWRRVMRYAFAVHCANHHQRDGEPTVSETLPELIRDMRAFCEGEEPRMPGR